MNRQQFAGIVLTVAALLVGGTAVRATVPTSACCTHSHVTPSPTPSPSPTPTLGPTPTPVPTPTPTPTPVPTATPTLPPTPTPGPNQYVYQSVNIYPAGDTFNNPVASISPAPASSAILASIPAGTFDKGDEQASYEVNLGTSATSTFTVQRNGGHTPPCYNTSTFPVPTPTPFIEPVSDAHMQVLLTDTGLDYESYSTKWTVPGGPLGAYSCQEYNLSATWASQAVNNHDAVTAAGLPYIGLTYWGEDASLSAINHMVGFIMATGHGYSQYGYVFPATAPSFVADTGCGGAACHNPIHNGDIWVLDPAFDCTPYSAKGQLVCNALKTYGTVLTDQASGYGLRFGLTTGGVKGWNYTTDLHPLLSHIHLTTSGHIVELSTIRCLPGHTYGVDCW